MNIRAMQRPPPSKDKRLKKEHDQNKQLNSWKYKTFNHPLYVQNHQKHWIL